MSTSSSSQKFVIIDGNAMLHRAYHALPSLRNKDGIPTGAVHGFFSMILKIIQELRPTYFAVTFDRPKPTFRKLLYVEYQATRPHMTSDLGDQITMVHEILEEVKIPIFEVDGFEADDVIGTIAERLQSSGLSSQLSGTGQSVNQFTSLKDRRTEKQVDRKPKTENRERITEIIIVTGDRDLLQLVNEHIHVLAPIVGISQMILYDEEKVREKYGIYPSQLIEYKALIGDSSDNYPGVPGVGPKTAMTLLSKYTDVLGIYKNIGEIMSENTRLGEKLAQGQEAAMLAKQLATIERHVPLNFSCAECEFASVDLSKLQKSFEKREFRTMTRRVEELIHELQGGEVDEKKKKTRQMKLLQ